MPKRLRAPFLRSSIREALHRARCDIPDDAVVFASGCVVKPDAPAAFAIDGFADDEPPASSLQRCFCAAELKLSCHDGPLLVLHHEGILDPRTSRERHQYGKGKPLHRRGMRVALDVHNGVVTGMAAFVCKRTVCHILLIVLRSGLIEVNQQLRVKLVSSCHAPTCIQSIAWAAGRLKH